ncbi:MAG: M20/M25/M40 family metallo-hydrolase [Gemmatimonadota bacterium]
MIAPSLSRLVAACALLLCAAPLRAQSGSDVARRYREAHEASLLRDFADLLKHPNVASDSVNIRRTAAYIRDHLTAVGVTAQLLEVPGAPPIVFGTLMVPGATRTLGVYVHYDGQPVNPAEWTHPPFEPTLYNRSMEAGGTPIPMPRDGQAVDPEWRLYARSAGDDRAPIAAILPVLRSFKESGVQPTSNLVFLFEGEEEAGSPHLEKYLQTHRDRFDPVNVWLFFDGPVHQSGRPLVLYGVRGSMGMEITVYGASRNLHSGHYGNWAPDTPLVLADLLRSMKDPFTGRVLIDGWYDSVARLGVAERAAMAAMPDNDAALKKELGLGWTEGQPETLAQRLLLPALTIRGMNAANVGALATNLIPSSATAALGIRLVKGNDPAHMKALVEAHLRKQGYHIVGADPDMETRLRYPKIVKVTGGDGYPAARSEMSDPFIQEVSTATTAAADRAFEKGNLILSPTMGGSLPLYLFSDVLAKPFIIVPVANHDDNQHAADENLRIANLWYAIDMYAALLTMPKRVVQ